MTSDPSWLDDPALSSKIYNLIRISLPFHIPANQDHIASATNSVLAAIRAAAPAPSPPPPNRGGTEDVAQRETAPSPRPDALATIAEHVRDLAWKATAFGHDASEYEWTTSYLLPAGPLHRLVGAMQSVGETCSLRSGSAPEDAQRIGDPSPDGSNVNGPNLEIGVGDVKPGPQAEDTVTVTVPRRVLSDLLDPPEPGESEGERALRMAGGRASLRRIVAASQRERGGA